jgi:transcriptional antiterminator NusG
VQTGCENTAKNAIEERIRSHKMEDMFGEILIPAESVVQLVKGQKQTKSRKFFPGYIFVQMVLNDKSWHLVRHSSKVSGFVGLWIQKNFHKTVSEQELLEIRDSLFFLDN